MHSLMIFLFQRFYAITPTASGGSLGSRCDIGRDNDTQLSTAALKNILVALDLNLMIG
jgi:hypothetical protein